jgi:hypothetical protein
MDGDLKRQIYETEGRPREGDEIEAELLNEESGIAFT